MVPPNWLVLQFSYFFTSINLGAFRARSIRLSSIIISYVIVKALVHFSLQRCSASMLGVDKIMIIEAAHNAFEMLVTL